MTKKQTIFRPDLACLAQVQAPKFILKVFSLLDVRPCRKLSPYSISRKTYDINSKMSKKTSFWDYFKSIWHNFDSPKSVCTDQTLVQAIILLNLMENQRTKLEKEPKSPNCRPDFGQFELNLGPKIVFRGFNLYYMLNIVTNYHCIQHQQKRMIQTQ